MTQISIVGNLTAPPDLRFTQSGKAVANVTVAVNRKRGETEETDFYRVTLWEQLAEHAAQLDKGTRVLVIGRQTQREYETTAGEKRTAWDVTADAFGPDLRFAMVTATRASASERSQEARTDVNVSSGQSAVSTDVWGAQAGAQSYTDTTPF